MEKTNIEHFNDYLKLFVTNIIETFPEYKEVLETYYSELLSNDSCNNDKYVKRFMKKTKDYQSKISSKDESLFDESICILKHVDFKIIWESDELSENNKDKIWEFIQTLYIIGNTIINDSNTIRTLLEKFNSIKNNETFSSEEKSEDTELLDMLKNISKTNEPIDENFIKNGLLGKLAEELKSDINIDDLSLNETDNVDDIFKNLLDSDNSMKFMNLVQSVGKKIDTKIKNGDINQEQLMKEAVTMMSSLQGNTNILNDMLTNISQDTPALNPTQQRLRKKLEEKKKKNNI
jgi:hypothetical protein